MASAEEVLATTFWIFFECHTCKWVDSAVLVMTGHWQDSLWRESKTAADAKKYSSESYKSKVFDRDPPDLDCSICKRLSIMQDGVPSISVATLSFLIRNCNQPRREHGSGVYSGLLQGSHQGSQGFPGECKFGFNAMHIPPHARRCLEDKDSR